MLFVGLDLGGRHSQVAMLDQRGALMEEARMASTQTAFRHKFAGLSARRIAVEVGTDSRWFSELLRTLGREVLVASARIAR
jgi:hypothetical protein